MTPDDERSCREVYVFVVSIFVIRADKAPNQDLLIIKELQKYSKIDSVISKTTLNKFQNQLWYSYLTPEVAAMAFFDDELSCQDKNKMKK